MIHGTSKGRSLIVSTDVGRTILGHWQIITALMKKSWRFFSIMLYFLLLWHTSANFLLAGKAVMLKDKAVMIKEKIQ